MGRYIVLDENNIVLRIRMGSEIVAGEIESDLGDIGDIKQPDGSFITPVIEPPVILPSIRDELQYLKRTILLDRLGGIPDFSIEDLRELYQAGKITIAKLDIAITKGWITEAQKAQIIAV